MRQRIKYISYFETSQVALKTLQQDNFVLFCRISNILDIIQGVAKKLDSCQLHYLIQDPVVPFLNSTLNSGNFMCFIFEILRTRNHILSTSNVSYSQQLQNGLHFLP